MSALYQRIDGQWVKVGEISGDDVGSSDGLTLNGIIREYEVNAGSSVNAGDFVEFVNKFRSGEFASNTANYISACKLDNNRVLVAYADASNSSYGTAVVFTIDGTTITVGEKQLISNATNIYYISVGALTDSKVFVAYSANGVPLTGTVLTVSNTTITVTTDLKMSNTAYGSGCPLSIAVLSDSKVVIAQATTNNSVAYLVEIGDSTITSIANVPFGNAGSGNQYIYAATLTDSRAVVVYGCYETSKYNRGFKAALLTTDDTSIAVASTTTIVTPTSNSSISGISVVALSDSKAVVSYSYSTTATCCRVRVLSVSGSTISTGNSTIIFDGNAGMYHSLVALTDNKVLLMCRDASNSNYATSVVLTIDETIITVGEKTVIDESTLTYNSLLAFSNNSVLALYNGGGASKYKFLQIDDTTITLIEAPETEGIFVQPTTSNLHNVGVAKTGGAAGEMVEVYEAV